MTLTVWRSTAHLCRMSLYWDLPAVILKVRLGLWLLGRKSTEIKCHFCITFYRGTYYPHDCWPGHLAGGDCQVSPLQLPFFLCSTLSSWEGVTLHSPHLRRGSFAPPPQGQVINLEIKWNYLSKIIIQKLFGILLYGKFVSSPSFIYLSRDLFRTAWTHGSLFYT